MHWYMSVHVLRVTFICMTCTIEIRLYLMIRINILRMLLLCDACLKVKLTKGCYTADCLPLTIYHEGSKFQMHEKVG